MTWRYGSTRSYTRHVLAALPTGKGPSGAHTTRVWVGGRVGQGVQRREMIGYKIGENT